MTGGRMKKRNKLCASTHHKEPTYQVSGLYLLRFKSFTGYTVGDGRTGIIIINKTFLFFLVSTRRNWMRWHLVASASPQLGYRIPKCTLTVSWDRGAWGSRFSRRDPRNFEKITWNLDDIKIEFNCERNHARNYCKLFGHRFWTVIFKLSDLHVDNYCVFILLVWSETLDNWLPNYKLPGWSLAIGVLPALARVFF